MLPGQNELKTFIKLIDQKLETVKNDINASQIQLLALGINDDIDTDISRKQQNKINKATQQNLHDLTQQLINIQTDAQSAIKYLQENWQFISYEPNLLNLLWFALDNNKPGDLNNCVRYFFAWHVKTEDYTPALSLLPPNDNKLLTLKK